MNVLPILIRFLVFAGCCQTCLAALPEIPEDSEKARIWHERRLAEIERLSNQAGKSSIDKLGAMVIQLETLGYRKCPERDIVLATAKQTLSSIPGVHEYYRARIVDARDEWEEAPERLRNTIFYDAVQPSWVGFGVLKHLPSAETVRVLGSLLDDERGRYIPDPARPLPGEAEGHAKYVGQSNCERAVTTLAALPLVAKPVGAPSAKAFDDVPAWRQWYREIAEGRRTFRFEGDPTEYDLDGPASADKLVRTRALRERERDRAARAAQRQEARPAPVVSAADGAQPSTPAQAAPQSPPGGSGSHPPYAALLTSGGILLAALAWFFLRRGKKRLPKLQA
jgi:hypothetical protein